MGSASGGLDKELKQESHTPDKGSPDGSPHRGGDAKGRGGLHNMNKKEYVKPSMEIVEVEFESLMLGASNEVDVKDEITEEDAWMSNGRRGKWGDLWADNESK